MEYWAIFNIALLSALSHCFGMCGGIVLLINKKVATMQYNLLYSNLLYNFGRLTSYILIGAFCGGFGWFFTPSTKIKSIVILAIGILLIAITLAKFLMPKLLSILEPSINQISFLKPFFSLFYRHLSYRNIFFIGMLNGFLPCGLVYYFALIAAASEGILQGMGVMAVFGLATMIPLFFSGVISNFFFDRRYFTFLGSVSMFCFGIYTIYKGLKGL